MRTAVYGLIAAVVTAQGPIVDIKGLGKVRGVENDGVDMFLGIKYATQERWAPPKETAPWHDIYNATEWGNACYGAGSGCKTKPYSEDCLYLNVYTPTSKPTQPLPVLLFIHGGSYISGCGSIYPGASLTRRSNNEVIVITINYRLGVFGFLGGERLRSLQNPSTGNYGLQDQRAAMKWAKDHVASFGGDPSNVMIFGESAGAGSVSCHLASRKSDGLYRKAIAESGLGASWCSNPMYHAEEVFTWLLGNTTCSDVACLKALTADEVRHGVRNFPGGELMIAGGMRHLLWAPVVDNVELTVSPAVAFAKGEFHKVPLLAGTNRDETAMFLEGVHNLTELSFDGVMLPFLNGNASLLHNLKDLYSNQSFPYPRDLGEGFTWWWWATMAASTDAIFTCPHRRATRSIAEAGKGVFSYVLLHPTSSPTILPDSGPGSFLVPHGSDVPYVYNCTVQGSPYNCSWAVPSEQELAGGVSAFWIEFAKSSSPGLPWAQYVPSSDLRLGFDISTSNGGKGFHAVSNFHKEQCDFWDTVQVG
eukprot:TRINITY_DN16949_c0_g1_i1.p1 TRINITY_DN16949_c0_g1~~TRINITY_DN16949_c0_g1_i1.p1  ORF type:complete len:533 (+),score=49.93 TRINITY_DN16949_c0_g1_i1:48-1646(+)